MNTGDVIQIEVPDFDPDIDGALPILMDQHTNGPVIQGSVTPSLKSTEKVTEHITPAPLHIDVDTQEFLEDYADLQGQIWKIFQKHQMIPDNIQDLHFHIDNFKNGIEKEFAFLKEATHKNIENFQSSFSLQQTYSASLCLHVNNIYNKLVELQ